MKTDLDDVQEHGVALEGVEDCLRRGGGGNVVFVWERSRVSKITQGKPQVDLS